MRGWPLILALALAGCEGAPQVTFADAAITLPDDPLDLPPGPGVQAVIENCTACHSPSTMLQQPRLSRDKWQGVVAKMITTYKAPVDEAAIPAIVDYMVAVQTEQAAGNTR
jgi:hypothetical protein